MLKVLLFRLVGGPRRILLNLVSPAASVVRVIGAVAELLVL